MTNRELEADEYDSQLNSLETWLLDFIQWGIIFELEDSEEGADIEKRLSFLALQAYLEKDIKGDVYGIKQAIQYLYSIEGFKAFRDSLCAEKLNMLSSASVESWLGTFLDDTRKELEK